MMPRYAVLPLKSSRSSTQTRSCRRGRCSSVRIRPTRRPAAMLLTLALLPVAWAAFYQLLSRFLELGVLCTAGLAFSLAYALTYIETLAASKKDGFIWPAFQHAKIWRRIAKYFPCSVSLEQPLDHSQQYIFCGFPHGACSLNHIHTMTNAVNFLSEHYKGERRDLAATVLHWIPFFKEGLLFLGCVDAGARTAKHNLSKGRSLLIFVGGEKEQLMTRPFQQKVYLRHRKGFVKLALQYGAHLVPMYCFGENEAYETSTFLQDFRNFLQRSFSVGICIFWGPWGLPYRRPLRLEVGKPIEVVAKSAHEITDKDVDELHAKFVGAIQALFDKAKAKYPEYQDAQLQVL